MTKSTMEELSFKQLFYLLCCPPCPSQITQKMAFLPPKISYELREVESKNEEEIEGSSSKDKNKDKEIEKKYEFVFMPEYADNGLDEKFMKDHFEAFYTKTKKKNRIACLHIKSPRKDPKFTVLFSHGNAADLGMLTGFYCRLVHQLNINLFSYDYSGYGRSSGTATEKNLYADIEAAWHVLLKRYDLKRENVILYGQSIGTACAVDLATKYQAGGVILHSPLMSGIRLLFPVKRTFPIIDAFPIIDKVSKIKSPTLVIHGTHDEIINFSHGLQIYDQLQNPVTPLWIKGAHHNDIEQYKSYFERLQTFMNSDLNRHEEKSGDKKKLRTKDLQEDFDEIQSNDDLNISLTISKSSSSVDDNNKLELQQQPPQEQKSDSLNNDNIT